MTAVGRQVNNKLIDFTSCHWICLCICVKLLLEAGVLKENPPGGFWPKRLPPRPRDGVVLVVAVPRAVPMEKPPVLAAGALLRKKQRSNSKIHLKRELYYCLTFTIYVLNITPKLIDHRTTCSLHSDTESKWKLWYLIFPTDKKHLITQQKEHNFALITYNLTKRTETPLI